MCITHNLYEFSQVNHNEMGGVTPSKDGDTNKDVYEEVLRIIRISDEIRVSLDWIGSELTFFDQKHYYRINNKAHKEPLTRSLSIFRKKNSM